MTKDQQTILQLLESNHTMTLATCLNDKPWAATVFYVNDSAFNLYFVSDSNTRHGRHLQANAWVAGAINPDCANWSEIRGLQFEGHVIVLENKARLHALGLYFAKFPDIKILFEQPKNDNETIISSRLLTAKMYQFCLERIRLIDNSQGFGYKAEIELKLKDAPFFF